MTTPHAMTPGEVREARALMTGWESGRQAMGAAEITKVLRYCRELERHAEAMAACGQSKRGRFEVDPLAFGLALTAYRTFTTTEPRRP